MENNDRSTLNQSQNGGEPRRPGPVPGCLESFVLFAVIIGITATLFIRHNAALGASIIPEQASQIATWIGLGVQLVLLSIVLIPLALLWPSPMRSFYQAWLISHLLAFFLLPGSFFNPTDIQYQALVQIIMMAVFIVISFPLIRWFVQRRLINMDRLDESPESIQEESRPNRFSLWMSILLIVLISAYPWLALGALGSFLDTVFMILVGLMLGWIAAILSENFIFNLGGMNPKMQWSTIFLQGLGFGVTLMMLASALSFSFSGVQLLLMITLPWLGWTTAALRFFFTQPTPPTQAPTGRSIFRSAFFPSLVLVGLVAALPLIFVDPDELLLVLSASQGEILSVVFQAAWYSALLINFVNLILMLIFFIRYSQTGQRNGNKANSIGRVGLVVVTVIAIVLAIGIYTLIGQPGLYGERMFVILKNQADVSEASSIEDYPARREFVYQKLVDHANQSQQEIRSVLDRFKVDYTSYYLVNAIEMPGNPLLRLWLGTLPEVDRILDSPKLRPLPEPLPFRGRDPGVPNETPWNIKMVGADKVWAEYGARGAGIVVGQSDSGVQADHPELADSYRGANLGDNAAWFDPWFDTTAPIDRGGHGTHTLGTILGNRTGIAPDAQWIACVNLARNLANPAYYLDCMQFNFAPFPIGGDPFKDSKPAAGAHVLNNSWGCPEIEGCDATVFQPAVAALRFAGVFVVASAGNDGPACGSLNDPPPIYAEVFSVGAIDAGGNLAQFSSIGPVTSDQSGRIKPDLLAPGVNILSSLPNSTYGSNSGTSMAGPHVVGAVALLWSANPDLIGNIDLTEQYLIEAASPYQGALSSCPGADGFPSTAYGYGILNIYEAVRLAMNNNP